LKTEGLQLKNLPEVCCEAAKISRNYSLGDLGVFPEGCGIKVHKGLTAPQVYQRQKLRRDWQNLTGFSRTVAPEKDILMV
jgi:hypothetical protein